MNKYFKTGFLLLSVIVFSLVLTGCLHKQTPQELVSVHTYGFFYGLLHGFIAPFDFIGMLFSDKILMYAPNNNGAWYAFGFLIGSGGWGFFGSRGTRYRRRPKQDNYGSAEVL